MLRTHVRYAHAASPAYQAEVGLLSRPIVIEGEESDSEPTDSSPVACHSYEHYTFGGYDSHP